jgi:chromosome segregation ATPase
LSMAAARYVRRTCSRKWPGEFLSVETALPSLMTKMRVRRRMRMIANNKLERAQASLKASAETLAELTTKLSEAEISLQDATLRRELGEGQQRTVDKWERESRSLGQQIAQLERTIATLNAAMPGLKRDAAIESAAGEGVQKYNRARDRYVDLLVSPPSVEGLTASIREITTYFTSLNEAQNAFLEAGKSLNNAILEHDLQEVGNVSNDTLRKDREELDHQPTVKLSDNLSEAAVMLEGLSDDLSRIPITLRNEETKIEDPKKPAVHEVCSCKGNKTHERRYIPRQDRWILTELRHHPMDNNRAPEVVLIGRGSGFEGRPEWPCEGK